ncbi:cytochrome P450 2B4-like [Paramacrobiotus metropolitanus]|uniref:cytochrome P450 2B4-like n=1 Tax=Paramacrobiotus metropolitanus TaxID=2943436 RepID=UPI00244622E0|nr:cytochrome P450 2B4-like [Paramacrobiotus metropolitanus]
MSVTPGETGIGWAYGGERIVLALVSIVAGWLFLQRLLRSPYRLPPGPWSVPVLGSMLWIDHKAPFRTFSQWADKYGRFFYARLGKDPVVVVNDAALVRQIFSSDAFQKRPHMPGTTQRLQETHGLHCGLIFDDGDSWKEHRRFVLRALKDFGMGGRSIEEKVAEEAGYLMELFRDTREAPFDDKIFISTAVANVISNVVANRRYDVNDPEFVNLLNCIARLFRSSFASALLGSYPALKAIPPFRAVWQGFQSAADTITAFFDRQVQDHLGSSRENDQRDLIDAYITALRRQEFGTFAERQLLYIVEDLMEAGYETTTTTLRWAFLLMCAYPEVQDRVQKELDSCVPAGSGARPSEQLSLPFTEAVLAEVHRYASIVPWGVMHVASADSQLEGYDLPRGTWILPNLYHIHHDPALWEEPHQFRPERFLTADGQLQRLPDYWMPFSVGKRRCPGESLAQVEFLMFFTAVLRNFRLQLPGGPQSADLRPVPGATSDTALHSLMAIPRS